jgi:stage II sporulation protein M
MGHRIINEDGEGGKTLFSKIHSTISTHVAKNRSTYFFLLVAFVIGVCAGAFTVNGLSTAQKDELSNYFQGFLGLLNNQSVDSSELFSAALIENLKIVAALWVLGVTIIGIPFIYLLIGIKGFITGFSSGFIISSIGMKGVLFTIFALLPKEIILVPCLIALGVNGINFSLKIIKNRTDGHILKDSLKSNLLSYCFVTVFFSSFILIAILLETYIVPVLIRIIAPVITG